MSGLTIDQSKNKDDVFHEIKLHYMTESDYHKWTITDFTFDRPSDADFYDNLKTGGNVSVELSRYTDGFKVSLMGRKPDGEWTRIDVGSLPRSRPT
jgi:hypothetical protein